MGGVGGLPARWDWHARRLRPLRRAHPRRARRRLHARVGWPAGLGAHASIWMPACELPSLTNFEAYRHLVAFRQLFCFSDAVFYGHNVEAIFGKQGGLPLGFADPNRYRDHSPAISHQPGYGFQVAARLLRNGNEVKRGRAFPKPNLAVELDVLYSPS